MSTWKQKTLYILILLINSSINVLCQSFMDTNIDNKTIDERAYCFRFTWLGPKFNGESQFKNATCNDVIKNDKNIPCTHPLIVTNNSNIPDTESLWREFQYKPTQIACRLVKGEVCAKVSYKFNGAVENITYLCTKVNIENDTAVNQGCYKQMKNGHELELCACESKNGLTPSSHEISKQYIQVLTGSL
ncbi:hypothetical protein PVAND_006567 [Polypedilum vanderplanki]|uniref:Uncharacterized protein n=1 Tax=Polypedilum vanderplanki TaxID=319348 RepID=A0A9J6C596_POLVA|nr:hypothetical protein PVAND_006567 [Polypedilum vanderplanki]